MRKSLVATVVLFMSTVFLGSVAYPAILWGFGQGFFPHQANGSLITRPDGTTVGSSQIAQSFTKDEYFWPRPSAAGYNAAATGGSNWGAAQPKLRDRVAQFLGPLVTYRSGSPVGPDIEQWFIAKPDRAATWATRYPTSAVNWARADMSGDEYGPNGKYIEQWARDHPEVIAEWKRANPTKSEEPKPEDLLNQFLESYVKVHPGTFPGLVPVRVADGSESREVKPIQEGSQIQALFFDSWLQDPANQAKVAEIRPVPADFVTASGAGMDPHITLRNAHWQLTRVARARAGGGDIAAIRRTIEANLDANAFAPLGGLAGEKLVNVLEINLMLDREFAVK